MNIGRINNDASTCIQLVKGLSQCLPYVKAMNLRALLGNSEYSKLPKIILKNTWEILLNEPGVSSSGLTDDEMLRLIGRVMKLIGFDRLFEADGNMIRVIGFHEWFNELFEVYFPGKFYKYRVFESYRYNFARQK